MISIISEGVVVYLILVDKVIPFLVLSFSATIILC